MTIAPLRTTLSSLLAALTLAAAGIVVSGGSAAA